MIEEKKLKKIETKIQEIEKLKESSENLINLEAQEVFLSIIFFTFVIFSALYFGFMEKGVPTDWASAAYMNLMIFSSTGLFFLSDKIFLEKHFSKGFDALSGLPVYLIFVSILSIIGIPITCFFFVLFKSLHIQGDNLIWIASIFAVVVFLLTVVVGYFIIFKSEDKNDQAIKEIHNKKDFINLNQNFDNLKKEVIHSVQNIDDYNLLIHFIDIHGLNHIKTFISEIEQNLIDKSKTTDFKSFKTHELIRKANLNNRMLSNE